jgi:pyridoxal/pyridoxine/pyridoxamine kinase
MLAGMGEATFITPNETEFSILTGRQYDSLVK